MIGDMRSHAPRFERHEAASDGARESCGAAGGPGPALAFASELARADDTSTAGADRTPWQKTVDLARQGGGVAKLRLSLKEGGQVELRVTVRFGKVTVFAHVSTHAAEASLLASRRQVAQALAEAGLRLHRFEVRKGVLSQHAKGRPDKREKREESPS